MMLGNKDQFVGLELEGGMVKQGLKEAHLWIVMVLYQLRYF